MCNRFVQKKKDLQRIGVKVNLLEEEMETKVGGSAYGLFLHEGKVALGRLSFGFPQDDGSFLYNARSETVKEKKSFAPYYEKNRLVIPCSLFYEKSKEGAAHPFEKEGGGVLFLAGFYQEKEFVLLTCPGEALPLPVKRMPLLLTREEVRPYLEKRLDVEEILKRKEKFSLLAMD